MSQSASYLKYIKYKTKYMELKRELEGGVPGSQCAEAIWNMGGRNSQKLAELFTIKGKLPGEMLDIDGFYKYFVMKEGIVNSIRNFAVGEGELERFIKSVRGYTKNPMTGPISVNTWNTILVNKIRLLTDSNITCSL